MQLSKPLPRPGIIIFDVDGTLIDVSRSYREALPVAAGLYLGLLGLVAPPGLSGDAYDQFKRMGGFNDDWDLTAGCLELLLAGLPATAPLPPGEVHDQPALVAALRVAAAPLARGPLPLPDIEAWIEPVRRAGGGLAGLRQFTRRHNAHLVCHDGDVRSGDLVQRVFEEIYLGDRLFAAAYGMPAAYYRGSGLNEQESLLISRDTLAGLSRFARLGIATGRARWELEPSLDVMGLRGYFGAAATMEQALAAQAPGGESLLKPHPYLLQRAAGTLDPTGRLVAAYVGDVPDDVIAAQRANGSRRWLSIALTSPATRSTLRDRFITLGADCVLGHPDDLLALWPG